MVVSEKLPAVCDFSVGGIRIRAESTKGGPLRFELRGGAEHDEWNFTIGRTNRLFPIFCHLLYEHLRKSAGVERAAS